MLRRISTAEDSTNVVPITENPVFHAKVIFQKALVIF